MIDVLNPADGTIVGQVERHSEAQVRTAIDRTCAASPTWSRTLARERSALLRKWFDLVSADKTAFAELICRENGKCMSEAFGEIEYGLGFVEWYAEEAKRVYGDT